MRSPKFPSTLLPLLTLALPAQGPGAVHRPAGVGQPVPAGLADVARGAGLQPDGPGRLLGCGTDYLVRFSAAGMQFVPALGRAAEQMRHVSLRPVAVRRGDRVVASGFAAEPIQAELRAEYAHGPAITERFDVGEHGVELSWQFDRRPAGSGDLVVRYELTTNLPSAAGAGADGLSFVQAGLGGVALGAVTGLDARGARVRGGLSFANGVLELSLPAAFVDTAQYPIVLDPLVGAVITVSTPGNNDSEPDVAYDATTQRYLVVWLRELAATLVLPRGRLVDASGSPVGNVVVLGSTGVCGRPRVANFHQSDRFGVVFEEQAGTFQGIQFRAVSAQTAAITHSAVLASSTGVDLFRHPDIGGVVNALNSTAFVVVYEDNILNAIRARRVYFDAADLLVAPSAVSIWTDSTGPFASSYTVPAISRQGGVDLTFLVVARRYSGIGPQISISGRLLALTDLTVLTSTTLESTAADDFVAPDVDGANGSWIVAWEREPAGGGATTIRRRSARYAGGAWTLGAIESLGGGLLQEVTAPSVGWSEARTWLGYHNWSGIGPQESLRVAAIDTASATMGGVEFTQTISSGDTRIVAATDASGGVNGGSGAMAVFAHGTTVYAQQLISYGNTGTFVSLGGQCGAGGAQYFSHAPGIGSSIVFGVVGLSPTALFTVFNVTPDQAPLTCGPCAWAPFAITDLRVPVGGTASVPVVLPLLPPLVGSQFVTQWTTYDPPQSACSLVPDFALTDRSLMTLGN